MRPALVPRVPEAATQEDLTPVMEAMEVVGAVKENLAAAVARGLTAVAKEDTPVAREAMEVAVKKDLAEVEDEEGNRL